MRPTNEYLRFVEERPPERKTPIVLIYAERDSALLGRIAWFGRWRQYAFMPEPDTTFNRGCLETINAYIDSMMEDRRVVGQK